MFGIAPPETRMSYLNPPTAEIRRRRLWIGGASVALTTLVMTGFLLESRSGYSGRTMNLIYAQSWSADRSRDEAIADTRATLAAQEAKLADARAYIATLSGKKRAEAQKQYDAYVAGGGVKREIPFVSAEATSAPTIAAPAAEPRIE